MLPRRRRTVQPTPRELAERSERRRKKGEVEWDGRGEAEIGWNSAYVWRGSVLECVQGPLPLSPAPSQRPDRFTPLRRVRCAVIVDHSSCVRADVEAMESVP